MKCDIIGEKYHVILAGKGRVSGDLPVGMTSEATRFQDGTNMLVIAGILWHRDGAEVGRLGLIFVMRLVVMRPCRDCANQENQYQDNISHGFAPFSSDLSNSIYNHIEIGTGDQPVRPKILSKRK